LNQRILKMARIKIAYFFNRNSPLAANQQLHRARTLGQVRQR
jgi:hypothetical protein